MSNLIQTAIDNPAFAQAEACGSGAAIDNRQSTIDNPASARASAHGSVRRGSVLVLVMTVLAMLFVMGVAFLATMNFEADRLAAEAKQNRTDASAELISADASAFLSAGLMANSGQPFAAAPVGAALASFATLPGWHNVTSPIEPAPVVLSGRARVVWPWHVDMTALSDPLGICVVGADPPLRQGTSCAQNNDCFPNEQCQPLHLCEGGINPGIACNPLGGPDAVAVQCGENSRCNPASFGGPTWRGAAINTNWENGTRRVCVGGSRSGQSCDFTGNCPGGACGPLGFFNCHGGSRAGLWCEVNDDCPGSSCVPMRGRCSNTGRHCINDINCPGSGVCQATPVTVVDADGDGIVDSILVEASRLGYSREQIAQLSAAVNPPSNQDGNVYVALRIIPHGGMVNLNDAHPRLIEAALGIPDIFLDRNPNAGNYFYRPAQEQVFYSALQEEAVLRRRNIFPPRTLPPTRLHGDPNVAVVGMQGFPDVWGDFPEQLFPPRAGQLAINGTHRYWPTRPFETITPDSPPLWQARMEPITAFSSDFGNHYDRRHLVTTTSHDDLLSRGATVRMNGRAIDVREAMMRVNEAFNHPLADGTLPFEYANYPRDLANNSRGVDRPCKHDALENCLFDRRKGRLQLSLPWLDEAIERWRLNRPADNPVETGLNGQRLKRLIYDAFYMMLLNASGPAWEDQVCVNDDDCNSENDPDPGRELCGTNLQPPVCIDRVLNLPRRDAKITRTAASLTANMLDYMDDRVCLLGRNDGLPCQTNADCPASPGGPPGTCPEDDMPTRVAVRYLTFDGGICTAGPHNGAFCRNDDDCKLNPSDPYLCARHGDNAAIKTCEGGADHGKWCTIPSDCQSDPQRRGSCISILGREINIAGEPRNSRGWEFAHGIERQPYITEVTTVHQNEGLVGWAVELFNPYDEPIDLTLYSLVEIDDNNVARQNSIPLTGTIPPQRFIVFYSDTVGYFRNLDATSEGVLREITGSTKPTFENGWIVALVLDAAYSNPSNPFESVVGRVVVDQIGIEGQYIGVTEPDRAGFSPPLAAMDLLVATRQRAVSVSGIPVIPPGAGIWSAPIGNSVELWGSPDTNPPNDPQLLGQSNIFGDQKAHPVEIQLADTGSFTRVNPNMNNVPARRNEVAFPTTGSMLTLMRHTSRSLGFFSIESAKTHRNHLAFTTALNEEIVVSDPNTGGQLATIREREQIDNGRMPIFDQGVLTGIPPNQVRYAAHHVPPRQSPLGRPGGVENLPWGQLVFDYFTALPLSNPGPYRVRNLDQIARDDAQPRVDQRGLRVHGRIDLNAAPWTVLSGLPFIPIEKVPLALRPRFENILYGPQPPQQFAAGSIFDFGPESDRDGLARSIVAYREMREGFSDPIPGQPVNARTGDYSFAGFGRGWFDLNPAFRRGTGFLTVGELANLRHEGAAFGYYRIDGGFVEEDPTDASNINYLEAIAVLASLGDWVTVRSQVFTVYGVIRGEADADAFQEFGDGEAIMRSSEAVDARALRFQETVDRLPTFLGETLPRRIGDRTLARYKDTTSD